jgi:hypothetical protein
MNILFLENGLRIGKDANDKKIYKGSTVIFHALKALNNGQNRRDWTRFYPHRHGLTDSRIGVCNKRKKLYYWHERYQIESAHEAYNEGELYLLKA